MRIGRGNSSDSLSEYYLLRRAEKNMPDIVFVRTYLSPEEQMGYLSEFRYVEIATGLCTLAAVTRQHDYETEIIDAAALQLENDELASIIASQEPEYVGITACTPDICQAGDLADKLKKLRAEVTIIVGGPHISAVPKETMTRFPWIDIAVLKEGERTIVELLDTLRGKSRRTLSEIAGIAFRDNKNLSMTAPRELIKDLDSLPLPAWDLLPDLGKYYCPPGWTMQNARSAVVITSRGCPNQCIFCDRTVFGNAYRYHSAEYVLEMLSTLRKQYGVDYVRILDDNFILNRKRLIRICEMILENGLPVSWSCVARADCIDGEMVHRMKAAGCRSMSFGIESGSQQILDFEKKNISLDTIARAVEITRKAGIKTMGYNILGHPMETIDTIEQTVAFNKKIRIGDCQFAFIIPFPGTELHKIANQYGSFEDDWQKMGHFNEPTFVPHGFTRQQLIRCGKRAYLSFYLQPRMILSYLGRIRSLGQLKTFILGGMTLIGWAVAGLFRAAEKIPPKSGMSCRRD